MAQECKFCGKKPQVGNTVSHANNKRKRRWNVNLRKVRILVAKSVQTVRMCTRCIRTGDFVKAA